MKNEQPQIAKLLTANGLAPNVARVLACWTEDDDELTSMDIEMRANLRQPEVSIATQELRRRGWLRYTTRHDGQTGAPWKVYTLAKPLADIARDIVRERNREIDRQQDLAAQLLQAVA